MADAAREYPINITFNTDDVKKGTADTQDGLTKIGKAADDSAAKIDKIGKSFSGIGGDKFAQLAQSATGAAAFGKSIGTIGEQAVLATGKLGQLPGVIAQTNTGAQSLIGTIKGLVLASGIFTAVSGIGEALKTIQEFEEAFGKLRDQLGLTSSQMDDVKTRAIALSTQTTFSASQIVTGYEAMTRAGVTLDQALVATPQAINLASAAQLDLAKAATIVANNLHTAKIEYDDIAKANDQLLTVSKALGGDIDKLAGVFKEVNPVVVAYGGSMQDAVAASALFASKNIDGIKAAGDLKSALDGLVKPGDDLKKSIKSAGLSMDELNPKTHTLTEVLDTIADKNLKLSDSFKTIGTATGATAFKNVLDLLTTSGGKVDATNEARTEGFDKLKNSLTQLKNAVEGVVTTIGAVGAFALFTVAVDGVSAALQGVTRLVVALTPFIEKMGIAAIIAFAPGIVLQFASALGTILAAATALAARLAVLALANPFTAAVLAIGAAIAALTSFTDKIVINAQTGATLGDVFTVVWQRITTGAADLATQGISAFNRLYAGAIDIANSIAKAFSEMINAVLSGLENLANAAASIVTLGAGNRASVSLGRVDLGGIKSGLQDSIDSVLKDADQVHLKNLKDQTVQYDAQNKLLAAQNSLADLARKQAASDDKDKGKKTDYVAEELKRITDNEHATERIKAINTLFDQGKISIDQYNERLQQLRGQLLKYDQSLTGGLAKGLNDVATGFTKFGDDLAKVVKGAFTDMTNAIVNFAKTGKFSFSQLAASILESLLKLSTNALFGQFAQLLLGNFGGAKSGLGGIQTTGTASAGIFSGLPSLGSLFGFATGGNFTVGGQGGTDSQIVAFKATPGEMVNVQTPGQQNAANQPATATPPPINLRIVNSVDPNQSLNSMATPDGGRVILNQIQANAPTIRRMLGVS